MRLAIPGWPHSVLGAVVCLRRVPARVRNHETRSFYIARIQFAFSGEFSHHFSDDVGIGLASFLAVNRGPLAED